MNLSFLECPDFRIPAFIPILGRKRKFFPSSTSSLRLKLLTPKSLVAYINGLEFRVEGLGRRLKPKPRSSLGLQETDPGPSCETSKPEKYRRNSIKKTCRTGETHKPLQALNKKSLESCFIGNDIEHFKTFLILFPKASRRVFPRGALEKYMG